MVAPSELNRIFQSTGLHRLRDALIQEVPRPIWWEIGEGEPRRLDFALARRTCRFVRGSARNRGACQRRFLGALGGARRGGSPVQFVCPIQRYAICFPLRWGNQSAEAPGAASSKLLSREVPQRGASASRSQTRGYAALCHSESAFSKALTRVASVALETAVREGARAEELKVLSESIQPRCVALSTIHTIHRLISSTLNLEELLPRVARLCCQVLRAQSCSIWLVGKDKKHLIPRAAIALSDKKGSRAARTLALRSCRVGNNLAGRVAASCKSTLARQRMAVPLIEEECVGVLVVRREGRGRPFSPLDQEILMTLAEQAVVAIRNAQMYEAQERVTWGTIRSLSAILDGMDPYTPSGPSRTKLLAEVALGLAREMRVPSAQQRSIEYAALLHDAGRLGIPEGILRKPAALDPAEFALVKEHTIRGASLLQPLEILEPAVPIILHHHERYDGTGYPKGLKGEAIPLGARILAVANAFEAMISHRPYRKAMSVNDAAREIASHAGTQFDPRIAEAFMHLVRSGRLEEVLSKGGRA